MFHRRSLSARIRHCSCTSTPLVFVKGKVGPRVVRTPVGVNGVTPAMTRCVHVHTPGTTILTPVASVEGWCWKRGYGWVDVLLWLYAFGDGRVEGWWGRGVR